MESKRNEVRKHWNETQFIYDWYDFLYLFAGVVDDFLIDYNIKSYPNAKVLSK